ncbi:MAG TPA: shikimate kinase [Clostridiales bacterium]|jgi:shikimate kinase|nr:shikimate kinase [Clostridiales bacterium]
MKNIVLIGMPGAGKSTIGVILAKVLGFKFMDSDLLIQEQTGMLLRDIIAKKGVEGFLQIENQVNQEIQAEKTVIATGGSIVYGREAMEHLKEIGTIVYISLSFTTITRRLGNIKQRGVVLKKGQTLKSLYEERCPLYEQYADIIINAEGLGIEDTLDKIVNEINSRYKLLPKAQRPAPDQHDPSHQND